MHGPHRAHLWGAIALATLAVAAVVLACAQGAWPTPETTEGPAGDIRTPVVFVPGVTGVGLRDAESGDLVWGSGKNLTRPHDRGHATARSVTGRHPGPPIRPAGVILDLKIFGIVRYQIYQGLVDLFVGEGYQWGDLDCPRSADEFFLFAYDWRQDNVASAALLADRLENLRRVRGRDELRINLICQSNGAHVCRYFAKYGRLNLAAAAAGEPREPAGLEVENLILVGASNGGSIRVLREMNRGRRYIDVVGRFWAPETLFTFSSLYQDLPVYTADLFVDAEARPLDIDLFDADSWRRYEWSIYGRQTARKLAQGDLPPWLGTDSDRRRFLVKALDRARRFHRLLRADAELSPATRYHLITNRSRQTSSRAVLVREGDRWKTEFGDDKRIRRQAEMRDRVETGGDGHATAASQLWLSSRELDRLGSSVVEVVGTHRRIILEPAAQRRILEILGESRVPDE